MNCQEARRVFFKYIDHELSLPEEQSLLAHLRVCQPCTAEFEDVLADDRLFSASFVPVEPPLDLTERIMAAYDQFEYNRIQTEEKEALPVTGWWAGIVDNWRRLTGNMQLRVAAVSIAVLAMVLFGSSLLKVPAPMVAGKDLPGTQGTLVVVPGGGKTVQVPDDIQSPDTSAPPTDPQTTPQPDGNKPQTGSKPTGTVKPETNAGGTGVVQLPTYASVENRVGSVEVTALVEGLRGSKEAPVLSADGKTLYYISVVDNQKQAWQLELKTDALPEKVAFEALPAGEEEKVLPQWWPGSLPVGDESSVAFDWSPNKQQLAVNLGALTTGDNQEAGPGVWLVQSDGTEPMQIAQIGGGSSLAWSGDGSKIVFTDKAGGIFVLYVQENVLIQVADGQNNFRSLRDFFWTPDHKKIIFYARTDGETGGGIYMITLP